MNSIPIILAVVFVFDTLFVGLSFASSMPEECDMFSISLGCDLSGWLHLILGDIGIAASLALLLHLLTHRTNTKIEQNSKATKTNSTNIQKIIADQEKIRKRRKIYVINSLKNHLNSLLLCVGLMSRFPDHTVSTLKETESILYGMQNSLNLSIDVLDPMLVNQIEKFLKTNQMNFLQEKSWNHESLKSDVLVLVKQLNAFTELDDIIK